MLLVTQFSFVFTAKKSAKSKMFKTIKLCFELKLPLNFSEVTITTQ